jgi:hypothetical protein
MSTPALRRRPGDWVSGRRKASAGTSNDARVEIKLLGALQSTTSNGT